MDNIESLREYVEEMTTPPTKPDPSKLFPNFPYASSTLVREKEMFLGIVMSGAEIYQAVNNKPLNNETLRNFKIAVGGTATSFGFEENLDKLRQDYEASLPKKGLVEDLPLETFEEYKQNQERFDGRNLRKALVRNITRVVSEKTDSTSKLASGSIPGEIADACLQKWSDEITKSDCDIDVVFKRWETIKGCSALMYQMLSNQGYANASKMVLDAIESFSKADGGKSPSETAKQFTDSAVDVIQKYNESRSQSQSNNQANSQSKSAYTMHNRH